MNTFSKYLFTVIFLLIGLNLFSQQKKFMNFDKNWHLSTSQHNQYYFCECYILESGAFDGPFTCYLKGTDTLVKKYHFENNVMNGEIYEYHDDGSPKLEAVYKKGQAIETWKEWDEEGDLVVEKTFDEDGKIDSDGKKKKLSDYEKVYFGSKEFEAPIYTTECILKRTEKDQYECSNEALIAYYNSPPLPPSYFNRPKFSGKSFQVKLKYQLSEKGKVKQVRILETSGDAFLDDLAETHILNMTPFESAKSYENPISYWIEAILNFSF